MFVSSQIPLEKKIFMPPIEDPADEFVIARADT